MRAFLSVSVGFGLPLAVMAGPAGVYSLELAVIDGGGACASSPNYRLNPSVSSGEASSSNGFSFRCGFAGQLKDAVGLEWVAPSSVILIDEHDSRPLPIILRFDDGSTSLMPSDLATWNVKSGPLSLSSTPGLFTAGDVFQDAPAEVQVAWSNLFSTAQLLVRDSIPDNFGSYAGDGVGDQWQVGYFGQPPNAEAGPSEDPDHDGQDNLFEFVAGLVPTDRLSRFTVTIEPSVTPYGLIQIAFGPIASDRIYTVEKSPDLGAVSWSVLENGTVQDESGQRRVIDPGAAADKMFYRVKVEKR